MNKKPVAMVIQRFGPTVIGGAESYANDLAVQIHDRLGRDVHVYTTCAESHMSWANEKPAGQEVVEFGKILRFRTQFGRWPGFGIISRCLIAMRRLFVALGLPKFLINMLENIWFLAQGPYCPPLIDTLVQNQEHYECLIAITYLYWPTLATIESLKIPKLIVPLAHDEAPFYFDRVRNALERADCVLSNVAPEAALIKRVAPRAKISVAGAGINFESLIAASEVTAPAKKPYLLYLGRISRGKGVDKLIEWMRTQELMAMGFDLVLAGHVEAELQEMIHLDHVRYAGHVSPQDKTSLIASAFAVINPSSHESLSLITLEALALGTPVLVNQNSEVLAYYAREVPTCFAYTDRTSLTRALGKLLDEAHTPDWPKQIETSKQWTQRNFDWHEVIKNFDIAINGQLFDRKPFQP